MSATIISDTSCLILLTNINRLSILKQLFDKIYITPIIAQEYQMPVPVWIEIKSPSAEQFNWFKDILFDEGESSAFALQKDIPEAILVLDDIDARKLAVKMNLPYIGTLGIIKLAKEKGLVESGRMVLEELKKAGMRLFPALEESFFIVLGEN